MKNALDNLTISTDPARKLPAFVASPCRTGRRRKGQRTRARVRHDVGPLRALHSAEVLPAVIADSMVKAAYPKLAFTDNPRAEPRSGCSSGGAAA